MPPALTLTNDASRTERRRALGGYQRPKFTGLTAGLRIWFAAAVFYALRSSRGFHEYENEEDNQSLQFVFKARPDIQEFRNQVWRILW